MPQHVVTYVNVHGVAPGVVTEVGNELAETIIEGGFGHIVIDGVVDSDSQQDPIDPAKINVVETESEVVGSGDSDVTPKKAAASKKSSAKKITAVPSEEKEDDAPIAKVTNDDEVLTE